MAAPFTLTFWLLKTITQTLVRALIWLIVGLLIWQAGAWLLTGVPPAWLPDWWPAWAYLA